MPLDAARTYCTLVEEKLNAHRCNFCDHVIRGSGITRVKNHLANVDATKCVKFCDKLPPEVKEEIRALLLGNVEKKKQKHTLDATIHRTLRKMFPLTTQTMRLITMPNYDQW